MRSSLHNFLAGFILSLTLASAVAAQSQPEQKATEGTPTGKISGHVVNDAGQPLADALVTVRTYGFGAANRTTTTDSDGSFQVTGLASVAYLISASFPGYVPAPRDPDVNPIGYYRVGESVRLEMIKGGVITGTVTRSKGEPVVVVPVRAYLIRDSKGQPTRYGTPSQERNTDDRGVYRIYGLAPGVYLVAAGGGRSSAYNVSAYGTDAPTYAPSSSTRDTAAEIVVHTGEEIADVDIRYRGETGHAVSGVVNSKVNADQPQGFSITLVSTVNGISQPSYSSFQPPGNRGFSIYGVADGDYDAIAQSFLPATAEWILSEPRRIQVRGADITEIELTASPLGSIRGRVTLEDSKAPECKDKRRPLFGETLVTPWHNEKAAKDQPRFVWGLGAPTLPDKQGDFALRNLAPGQYRFNARPMVRYWYLKSISWQSSSLALPKASQPADAARNWTTLKPGDRLSGLTITLAEGAASLQGQIDVAEGQSLPSKMFVYLVPAEREKSNDVLRFFTSIVLADGTFEMTNLAPGRYRIVARAVAENESNMLSKLRLPDEVEMRAKLLREAEATNIETELKPCQNVRDYRVPLKAAGSDQ